MYKQWELSLLTFSLLADVINHHCWITEEPKRHYPLVVRNVDMNVTSQHTQVLSLSLALVT